MVPRFQNYIKLLSVLFSAEINEKVFIRVWSVLNILYGFFGASKEGFGSTSVDMRKSGPYEVLKYSVVIWKERGRNASSKFREFQHLLESMEQNNIKEELVCVWYNQNNYYLVVFQPRSVNTKSLGSIAYCCVPAV